jgi:hypothetical protein
LGEHAGVRINQGRLGGGEAMVDQEGPAPDFPERLPSGQVRQQLRLGVRQAEQLPGVLDLTGRLPVDDPGFGVGQQPFGEADLVGAGGAGRGEVGEAVHDEHVVVG